MPTYLRRWEYDNYGAGWSLSLRLSRSWHPYFIFAVDDQHKYVELFSLSWSSSEGFKIQRSYPY